MQNKKVQSQLRFGLFYICKIFNIHYIIKCNLLTVDFLNTVHILSFNNFIIFYIYGY
jgi:hypothetical protein